LVDPFCETAGKVKLERLPPWKILATEIPDTVKVKYINFYPILSAATGLLISYSFREIQDQVD